MSEEKMEQEKQNTALLRPVETKRASEAIFEQIKELILKGGLCPGERLPSERKMMEMMGRSRPTIREAMRMLEREGYVKIIPGSNGAVVQEPGLNHVVQSLGTVMEYNRITLENILEFRQVNETAAVRLAAERRTKGDLLAMKKLLKGAGEQMEDTEACIASDVEFHSLIAVAAQNEVFGIMFQVCRDMIGDAVEQAILRQDVKGQMEMKQGIMQMHYKILQFIEAGDPQKAQEAMTFHLKRAEEDLRL